MKLNKKNTIESFSIELMTIPGCTCRSCRCKDGNETADGAGKIEKSSGSPAK